MSTPNDSPIKGYRQLNAAELMAVNTIKNLADSVEAQIRRVIGDLNASGTLTEARWLAIGQTDLQTGFMAINRAITKPTSF